MLPTGSINLNDVDLEQTGFLRVLPWGKQGINVHTIVRSQACILTFDWHYIIFYNRRQLGCEVLRHRSGGEVVAGPKSQAEKRASGSPALEIFQDAAP